MVDRAVLLVALVFAGVLVACGAIFLLRDYMNPVFVNGGDTAHRIDTEIGDTIAARFAEVPVGAAHCPPLINLSGRNTGRCTLPVADGEMRVEVAKAFIAGFGPTVTTADALFVTRDAEPKIAARLAERYGEQFDVHCPGPAVRMVENGAPVTCSVEAPDILRRGIEVHVSGYEGNVGPESLASVPKRAARIFGADVAQRTAGSVAVSGAAMERYVQGSAAANAAGEVGRRGLVGRAHCPKRIVLNEGGRTTCTVRVGGLPFTYDVHFEKGPGLYVQADKDIEVVALLRDVATRYFERPANTGGKPLLARVDCGTAAVAFVEPGSSVPCTATVDGRRRSFTFDIDDASGDFSISLD